MNSRLLGIALWNRASHLQRHSTLTGEIMGFLNYSSFMEEVTINNTMEDRDFQKTQQGAGALVASAYYDHFEGASEPAANTFPTGSNAFVPVSNVTAHNVLKFTDAPAGKSKHLIYADCVGDVAGSSGTFIIYDLLGFNCDFNLNANTTYNTGDVGTKITRYTTGKNVALGIVMQVTGAGTLPTVTINYTSSNGAGRTTGALTLIAGAVRGRYGINSWRIPLQSGDYNALSIQSVVTAGGVGASGKIAVMFMRKLGYVIMPTAQNLYSQSFINPQNAPIWPKIENGAAINFAIRPASAPTTPTWRGSLYAADGTDPV